MSSFEWLFLNNRQVEVLDQGSQDQYYKTEFIDPKLKLFGKKKLGPILEQICSTRISIYRISPGLQFGYGYFMQKFRLLSLLFVAATFKIKNLFFTFFVFISPYVWTQNFLIKYLF